MTSCESPDTLLSFYVKGLLGSEHKESGSSDGGIFVPSSPDTLPHRPSSTEGEQPRVGIASSDTDDSETALTTKYAHTATKLTTTADTPLSSHISSSTTSTSTLKTNPHFNNNISPSPPKKKHPIVIEDDDKENKDHKKQKKDTTYDESNQCSICMDSWKTSGLHRPCALKCGHLFGKSCVEKWLKEKRKCPNCMGKASVKDIRVLFINKISAIDPSEVEKVLKREAELHKKLRLQAEAFAQLHKKYEKLKAQLERDRFFQSNSMHTSSSKNAAPSPSGFFGASNNSNNNNNNKTNNITNNTSKSPSSRATFSSRFALDNADSNTTTSSTTPNKQPLNSSKFTNTTNTTTTTSSTSSHSNDNDTSPRPLRSSSTFTFGSTSFLVHPHAHRPSVNNNNTHNNNNSNNNNTVVTNKPVHTNPDSSSDLVTYSQPVQTTHSSTFSNYGFSSHTPTNHKPKSADSTKSHVHSPKKLLPLESPNKIVPGYPHFELTYSVQTNESRVFDFCSELALLLVSHSKAEASDTPQGILKISGLDRSSGDYIPNIHSRQIRDIKAHPSQALALTVSLDKSLKLVHVANKTVVMEYPLENPGWSCTWGEGTDLYCGQANGTVCMFDTRMPRSEPVVKVSVPRKQQPVHSLAYLYDSSETLTPTQKGVVCGSVGGVYFMEGKNLTTHVVPLEGNCSSVSYNEMSQTCLASYRNTPIFSKPTHVVFKHEGLGAVTEIRTLHSSSQQTRLSRSTMFEHPSPTSNKPSLITAASDEYTKQVILWDVSTGSELQKLPPQLHQPIDIKHFRHQNTHFLATLTESSLHVHNWIN